MDFHKRILIFPGGTESGLEIWKALKDNKFVTVYSAGSNVSNHAPFVFVNHFILPTVFEVGWVSELNSLVEKEKIDYIYPAHDDVLKALADNLEKIRTKVIMPDPEIVKICRSKSQTYRFLNSKIPTPKLYVFSDEIDKFPVFVKPDVGQGSFNAMKIMDKNSLDYFFARIDGLLIMEYLPGREFTVDCFSDREKGLLFSHGRERVRTRNGISVNTKPSQLEYEEVFEEYAKIISDSLEISGAWFFQVKQDKNGVFTLLEIGTRIAGGMALYRVLGVNFPLLSIFEAERMPIQIIYNNIQIEMDRALVNRYKSDLNYGCVYVDLDDCLIIKGKVNLDLLKFLFQCLERHTRVNLLTRNENNTREILREKRIENIFDEIIVIDKIAKKSDYIKERNSILIDDSFIERLEVFQALKIPVFEPSSVELLLDDRK